MSMSDLISRAEAIDAVEAICHDTRYYWAIKNLPSAQPERILYANMSDAEFEKWLYEHGICHPNIHESIPCDAVPLLIDNAISELPSAQPETTKRIVGKSKGDMTLWYQCDTCGEPVDVQDSFCRGCGRRLTNG